ncbi:uncharacterized protein LOC143577409 [Bidens hawaiensis]|uniref:uncharacterized protein LOC143577409 n=1 Tax=Bidens hawaiensis TaxID=980011 RepID=UPI004049818B
MEAPGKSQVKTPIIEPQVEKEPVVFRPPPEINIAHVPYPACLKNQKYTREYGHFLDMFRQLKINLPFVEALQHVPKYAKFLKDLLKRKDRLGEISSIPLSGDCSAVVLNQLTPTHMSLSLEDRSVKYPRGIIENLLVKVDKFVFPVDFMVLDMEADKKVPIILGRPFFRTAKALIDVYEGRITLRVDDENVTYDIAKSMKHQDDSEDVSGPFHSVYFLNSFISGFDKCLDYICGTDLVGMELDDELIEIMEKNGQDVVDDDSCSAEIMEWVEAQALAMNDARVVVKFLKKLFTHFGTPRAIISDRGKLRSKWTGPYLVKEVFPYGVLESENLDNGTSWKVNGHRLKHYLGGLEESTEVEETPLDPSN